MEENQSSIGSIIGTIIIIALIVLGGLYFWGKHIEEQKLAQQVKTEPETTTNVTPASEADQIRTTGTSDDLGSIDTDLQSTNTTNLDTEIQ
jgi:hypothetical protein